MAKTKTPLFGLETHGTIANKLTFQKRNRTTFARNKPTPIDPKTLAQIYHRWDYQDYALLWHSLTLAQQQQWESNARRLKITGFNYWIRTHLKTLPDLAGRWHLDERSGSQAHDSSKNTNNGTIYGATPSPGYIDYCLYFDGIDDRVKILDHPSLKPTNAITIMLRFYALTQTQGWSRLIAKGLDKSYEIRFQNNFNLRPQFVLTDVGWIAVPTPVILNIWYHIAATYDKDAGPSNMKLYLNAQLIASTTKTLPITQTTHNLGIGDGPDKSDPFKGYIDEVKIYNRALTAQEIKIHYERKYPE